MAPAVNCSKWLLACLQTLYLGVVNAREARDRIRGPLRLTSLAQIGQLARMLQGRIQDFF